MNEMTAMYWLGDTAMKEKARWVRKLLADYKADGWTVTCESDGTFVVTDEIDGQETRYLYPVR